MSLKIKDKLDSIKILKEIKDYNFIIKNKKFIYDVFNIKKEMKTFELFLYIKSLRKKLADKLKEKKVEADENENLYSLICKIDLIKVTDTFKKKIHIVESINQSRTYDLHVSKLISVDKINVDTGNVSYEINGENVTIKVNEGDATRTEEKYNPHKFSKNVTDSKTSSTNNFSNTINYNKDGYSGTLSKNGDAKVISGVYVAGESKNVTVTRTSSSNSFTDSFSHSDNGYSGTVSKDGSPTVISGSYTPSESKYCSRTSTSSSDSFNDSMYVNEGEYSGTISKDGSSYQTGSYTPGDSKTVTDSLSYNIKDTYIYLGGWKHLETDLEFQGRTFSSKTEDIPPEFYNYMKSYILKYNSNGYKGDLTFDRISGGHTTTHEKPEGQNLDTFVLSESSGNVMFSGTVTRQPSDTRQYHQKYSGTIYSQGSDTRTWQQKYSGILTKPGTDTREWQQDYSGTVYSGGNDEIKYYDYNVNIECIVRAE